MTSPATISIGGWDDGTVLIGVESSREPSAWQESARFTGVRNGDAADVTAGDPFAEPAASDFGIWGSSPVTDAKYSSAT